MAKPKFFRDPVHVQLRFENVDVASDCPGRGDGESRRSWLMRRIIDSREFQRLRHIRQNGLANLVFHGAEHSRFTHSMGVAYIADEMYARIIRNCGEDSDSDKRLTLCAAALLHDVGHGPFSHTLEDIVRSVGIDFHHETMTTRIVLENSEINGILCDVDSALPEIIASYVDKSRRSEEHWCYRIVSSQLDADRIDYVHRDSLHAGIKGHGFDLARLLDLLYHEENRIAVERGAIEAVEAYLVTLDQLYRAMYYHHAVRAANFVLTSAMRRAVDLHRNGAAWIFPNLQGDNRHPMCDLLDQGERIDVSKYIQLKEFHIWSLLEDWQLCEDSVLSEMSTRVMKRELFKTIVLPQSPLSTVQNMIEKAKEITKRVRNIGDDYVDYYVHVDEPERTSYKRYDWRSESKEESIWMTGEGREPQPIEDEEQSTIVAALKDKRYFPRLVVLSEVREELKMDRE